VTAIGAEKLDLLVPELLPVTIKFALAPGTGHPKNFRHEFIPPGVRFLPFECSAEHFKKLYRAKTPRRKEEYVLNSPKLGVTLRLCASRCLSDSVISFQPKISNIFG
jgi:hypothetical protein